MAVETDSDNVRLMATYFDAWRNRDFGALRTLVSEEIEFSSALGHVFTADDFIRGMQSNLEVIRDITVRKILADGEDVMTWFEIHTGSHSPIPAANFSHIEGGVIVRAQAAFDSSALTAR